MTRKLIITETESHVQAYVRENNLKPRDYIVVTSFSKVYGCTADEWELVLLGNCYLRFDDYELQMVRSYLRDHGFLSS